MLVPNSNQSIQFKPHKRRTTNTNELVNYGCAFYTAKPVEIQDNKNECKEYVTVVPVTQLKP